MERVRGDRPGTPRSRAATLAVALAGVVAACSGGTSRPAAPPTSGPASSVTSPTTATPCSTLTALRSWPIERRAALLVVVPVLDFAVAGAGPQVHAGAGGVLFLGSARPPLDLGRRVASLGARSTIGPPLVMADEEGGGIQRLLGLVSPLPWPRDLARTMSPDRVRALAATVGRQMRASGVSVDLAPVLDVDAGPGPSAQDVDGARSFSGDPATAARYGIAFMRGLRDGGVLPVVKHFPGLGGSSGNSDLGPMQTRSLADLRSRDLRVFGAAIRAGAPAVMVANASVPGLTSSPASLSAAAINGLLRGQLGFRGLVLTDSLSAGAVTATVPSLPAAAVAAVAAGADMVLFGSTLTAAQTALLSPANVQRSFSGIVHALVAAVGDGSLSVDRLDAAAAAVLSARHARLCR